VVDMKPSSVQCPGCHSPLTRGKSGSTCHTCGWTVTFSDDGDWFIACYDGKVDKAELERIREMARPYRQAPAVLTATEKEANRS